MPQPHLHVTSGDSAAGGLLGARLCARAAMLVHRDVLSCGPLAPLTTLERWRSERSGYWDELLEEIEPDEAAGASRWDSEWPGSPDLWRGAEALRAAETITVWLGRALSDQLLLAFLVELADVVPFDVTRVRVVQFHRHADLPLPILGVGQLHPEQIRRHPGPCCAKRSSGCSDAFPTPARAFRVGTRFCSATWVRTRNPW